MGKIQRWALCGFVVIILAGGAFMFQQNSNAGGVTVYPVQCAKSNVTNLSNCTKPVALEQSEYFVDKISQSVTVAFPSEPNSVFERRSDCIIVDKSNWSCGADSSLKNSFGFKEGNYFSTEWDTTDWSIIYVSKDQWNSINHGQDGPF